ncbi:MAG TPA: BON domain-containing protein [Bryobacteraceae bacterium]|nr:BON domain-containing protein [Bryobacteraceae bacterium]
MTKLLTWTLPFVLCGAALAQAPGQSRIQREVLHELRMLPYYTVFDNIGFRVDGNTVTLIGQVTRPTLKSDAGRVVKGIEGVESVRNDIEVLPESPMDWQIRRAVFNAIYRQPGFEQYGIQAVPQIHIIVKNGHVTLVGYVMNEGDKTRAGMAANSVPNVFSVDNELQVSK